MTVKSAGSEALMIDSAERVFSGTVLSWGKLAPFPYTLPVWMFGLVVLLIYHPHGRQAQACRTQRLPVLDTAGWCEVGLFL